MVDIDRQMVRERYALIKKTVAEASAKRTRPGKQRTSEPGKAEASVAMRFLSSLFVYAQESYEDTNKRAVVVENPVKALKTAEKSWRTVPRRQNVILPGELSKFYEGLELLRSDTARDYLLGLMLTGLRRRELAALTWDEIDWDNKSLIIPASRTKNKKAHGLPLSDVLLAMLKRRKETASGLYVFPNRKEGRFFDDPSASIRTVAAHMGKSWSCHDARRSFITVAEMLEIPPYTLKMLLNHSNGDVTGGYIISNIERLRGPMQQITDFMIERMGAPSPKPEDSKVTEISRAVAKRAAREKG
jgi:integrase